MRHAPPSFRRAAISNDVVKGQCCADQRARHNRDDHTRDDGLNQVRIHDTIPRTTLQAEQHARLVLDLLAAMLVPTSLSTPSGEHMDTKPCAIPD